MATINKPLKEIVSKYFFPFWRKNNHKFHSKHHQDILDNVNRLIKCGDINIGYTSFLCLKCNLVHKTPFSCKSRFCSSCGKIYAESWANKVSEDLIQSQHRHVVFSLPVGKIRDFFFKRRHLLKDLANASFLALKYCFKKQGVHDFGLITTIHTFSRKVEWNPHIHCLVTFGGLTSKNQWKNIKSLSWNSLRKSWQKCALDIISNYAKENDSQVHKNRVNKAYADHPDGYYVNAKTEIQNPKQVAKYIGRYLARPAIAEYRITYFNDDIVKFWYEDAKDKKRYHLTLSMEDFLGRILSHIPPKNFKMVRRFGLYSRRSKNKMPRKIKLFKTKSSWTERFFKVFGINPLICRKCSSPLHLLEIFHVKYGIIQYNDYSP